MFHKRERLRPVRVKCLFIATGPIMCIQASFGSYAFVLDTQEAITELFEKRSKVFSCRPRWVMAELSGRQNNVGLMYYGERLRNARKVLHRGIGPQTVPYWEQLFNYESLKILSDVRSSPERFFDSVPQYAHSPFSYCIVIKCYSSEMWNR